MTIWMKVTSDKYELPLILADSVEELARKAGTTRHCVESAISHAKKREGRCSYQKVEVEEDDEGTV